MLGKNFDDIVEHFKSGQYKHSAKVDLTVRNICRFSIAKYSRRHSVHFAHVALGEKLLEKLHS